MDSVPGCVGKKTELLREQLRCAICLEVYRRPRSLACLHCFCEGCLESVIRRNTDKFVENKEIECPVCHAGTTAPAGTTTVEEWAKCLPIDYIVSPRPHDTHTESESTRVCGHCAAAEEIVDAVSYCLECNDFLCQKCTRIHKRVSVSKHHKVSNMVTMSQSQNAASQIRVGMEDHISSDVVEVEGSLGHMTLTPCARNNLPPIVDCRVEKIALVDVVKRKGSTHFPFVRDLAYLNDGRLVYVDYPNSLCCLMDDTYTVVADVKLPNGPLSVVVTGDSELVVATVGKQLHVLSVHNNTLTLIRTISCNRQSKCLAKVSETELMVGWFNEGLGVISLIDGTEKTYLDHDTSGAKIKIDMKDYITVDNNRSRIYFTQRNPQNTLRCISLDGAPTFVYTDDQLQGAAGVALDRDGNVYVCDSLCNNVHQISPEGVLLKRIEVGFERQYLYSICFNNTGDQMAVVNTIVDNIDKLSVLRFALPV